jgi:hypothetical protein
VPVGQHEVFPHLDEIKDFLLANNSIGHICNLLENLLQPSHANRVNNAVNKPSTKEFDDERNTVAEDINPASQDRGAHIMDHLCALMRKLVKALASMGLSLVVVLFFGATRLHLTSGAKRQHSEYPTEEEQPEKIPPDRDQAAEQYLVSRDLINNSILRGSVCIHTTYVQTWLDKLLSDVEDSSGKIWDWYPLRPPRRELADGEAYIHWQSVSFQIQVVRVTLDDRLTDVLGLRRNHLGANLSRPCLCY